MLPPLSGSILDIGCGTGLLTEIAKIDPQEYLGIDPSKGMLEQFTNKYPAYKDRVVCEPFDGKSLDCRNFDNIVALFGSPSYLSRYAVLAISQCKARKFLMFYKENIIRSLMRSVMWSSDIFLFKEGLVQSFW